MPQKYPIHELPLPKETLQSSLPSLKLEAGPISQRRSTTFSPSTNGIWARVDPLWTSWPLRITKDELMDMGVDVDNGGKISVDDVLSRWDAVDVITEESGGEKTNGESSKTALGKWTSKHRSTLQPHLLGLSKNTIQDNLPHLNVGDAGNSDQTSLINVLSGRQILSTPSGTGERSYGPWSTRYCGHQFGVWAGQLGDGRAISLLETVSEKGGRQEIQLKGGGRTPFSRQADGLAVLRSGVREYLGCEAIAALNIPTTRALALLTADAIPVIRETGPEPPSLLARVAPSFIRIGHFEALNPAKDARDTRQFFFGGNWQQPSDSNSENKGPLDGQGDLESLSKLTRWCMLVMSELGWLNKEDGVKKFFEQVVRRNAEMVAFWQVYGFCHGVINTDNVSILGLTIDYGPYAFMDIYDESHICNHSDPSGLYNYRNQPSRIHFALDKLYQALSPLIGLEAELSNIPGNYNFEAVTKENVEDWIDRSDEVMNGWEKEFWRIEKEGEKRGWMKRFGLKTYRDSDDRDILGDYLALLHAHNIDFQSSFRQLSHFQPLSSVSELDNSINNGNKEHNASEDNIAAFSASFVEKCIVARREEEKENAKKAFTNWFKVYRNRINSNEEKEAWSSPQSNGAVNGIGNGNGETSGEWAQKRRKEMLQTNPRFVLRQWVLEELIKKMEEGVIEGDEAGRETARKDLDQILQMSLKPFEPYGEELESQCPTQELEEEMRLCGIGGTDMLGFQCSCSS